MRENAKVIVIPVIRDESIARKSNGACIKKQGSAIQLTFEKLFEEYPVDILISLIVAELFVKYYTGFR